MILTLPVNNGWITTNCYFFGNDAGRGFLIDPGAEGDQILAALKEKRLVAEQILITHGHCDHIGAAAFLAEALAAPILLRDAGKPYAENPYWNLSALSGDALRLENVTYFSGGARLALDSDPSFGLQAIASPGHTADGTVFYSKEDGLAFTGDTIFARGPGRTDLPGGDDQTLLASIRRLFEVLPDGTVLYPGHGAPTRAQTEKPLYCF